MLMRFPFTGAVVDVADEAAERYAARGFKAVAKPQREQGADKVNAASEEEKAEEKKPARKGGSKKKK